LEKSKGRSDRGGPFLLGGLAAECLCSRLESPTPRSSCRSRDLAPLLPRGVAGVAGSFAVGFGGNGRGGLGGGFGFRSSGNLGGGLLRDYLLGAGGLAALGGGGAFRKRLLVGFGPRAELLERLLLGVRGLAGAILKRRVFE
jgi:hypothetical protein